MTTKTTGQAVSRPAGVPTKQALCNALAVFIAQRSGIEWGNYGGSREAFMGDYRPMLKHGKHARTLLRAVELRDSITAETLLEATRAFSGRLQFKVRADGAVGVDYCAGQYFVTEYRQAACAVLASALWTYFRENMPPLEIAKAPAASPHVAQGIVNAGEYIRRKARREFGRAIATTWFN